jgi:ribulose-bisphosphate carboxylase large chain
MERVRVTYRLACKTAEEARKKAEDICLEQTVEFPADLLPEPRTRFHENVIGRIEGAITAADGGETFLTTISYPVDATSCELTQFLNVLFGNISIKPGIRVDAFSVPRPLVSAMSAGPRFGIAGLRALLGVPERPLLLTALKPMGLSTAQLADLAHQFALGGIDIIKDDHGLSNQRWAPFEERVAACAAAVARANAITGRRCVYAPNVTAAPAECVRRARFARAHGAGALLVSPMLAGLGTMHELARDDSVGLPILAHPALLGTYVLAPGCGFSHAALFGSVLRLAGADVVIFPSWDGRFSFSREECRSIDASCKGTDGSSLPGVLPAFPSPAGGMTLEKIADMREVYLRDVAYLVGSGLFRAGPNIVDNCKLFLSMVQ